MFAEIGDDQNEMGVLINMLDLYLGKSDLNSADSLYPILVNRVEKTDWYAMQSKLYAMIALRYRVYNDTIRAMTWADKGHSATVSLITTINSNQMASVSGDPRHRTIQRRGAKKVHCSKGGKRSNGAIIILHYTTRIASSHCFHRFLPRTPIEEKAGLDHW